MSEKIFGCLIWPYQILQIMGYRLVGVPCRYEFGNFGVEPLQPITRNQQLVSSLIPLLVVGLGWITQLVLVVYLARLYQERPVIPLIVALLSTPPLALYTHYGQFAWKQQTTHFSQHHAPSQHREY